VNVPSSFAAALSSSYWYVLVTMKLLVTLHTREVQKQCLQVAGRICVTKEDYMKAAVVKKYGAPEIAEFEEPHAKDGLKVVDILMAGLNPVDIILASGNIPAIALPLPGIVGKEGVGIMDGKRVYFNGAVSPFGSVAQRTLVDPASAFDVPEGLTNEQAITTGVAASTAYIALSWRAKIQPGENVIILGATGAVGRMAVEAAKLLGAGRVIAAGRNEKVLESLKSVGADATVTLDGDVPSTVARFAEASQGRINVIIDLIWGPHATAALLAASPGARLIAAGFAAAAETPFSPAVIMRQQASIQGFAMLTVPLEVRREAYARLAAYVLAGKFKLPTEVYTLADLATAWDRQQKSPNGKIIIDMP
jgi:NADPH:quinone reductase-like Zn-dependent oxidoreductase